MVDLNAVYQEIKELTWLEKNVFEEVMQGYDMWNLDDPGKTLGLAVDLAKGYTGGPAPTEYKYHVWKFWNGGLVIKERERKQV